MNRRVAEGTGGRLDERRRAHAFKAVRQAAFSRAVRTTFLDDGRKKKDEERARMEAYRKLCAEEGITSKRLEEYDRTRREAAEALGKTLEEVDYDQSLTNNEKKKRKYNLKRKYAATTVTELVEKKQKKVNAITKVEDLQQKREAEREAKRQARESRERLKMERIEERRARNALFARRTKRGQPVMASRVEALLKDLTSQPSQHP